MVGLLVLGLLLILASIVSSALLSSAIPDFRSLPVSLRIGASYAVGYAATAIALVAVSKFLDFWVATATVFLVAAAMSGLVWWRSWGSQGQRRSHIRARGFIPSLAAIGAVLVTTPAVLLMWIRAGVDPDSPWSFVGSLHSVRYAWISNYITACGEVPVLGQNFAQSVLAGVPTTLGSQVPYVALTALLAASLVGLALVTYGLLDCRGVGVLPRVIGTVTVLGGGTALSLTHVLTIDSGLPLGLNGYADTLMGLGLVVVFLLLFSYNNTLRDMRVLIVAAQTIVVAGLAFFAATSLILLVALALLWGLLTRADWQVRLERVLLLALPVTLGFIVALPLGGMLTPETFRTVLDYSGVMAAGALADVQIVPQIPFYLPGEPEWVPGWSTDPISQIAGSEGPHSWSQVLWSVEELTWRALRLLFWPLLGSVLLLVRRRYVERRPDSHVSLLEERTPAWSALLLLGMGFIVTFTFSLGSLKWEMARFLLPGIYLGLVGLALGISTALASRSIRPRILGASIAALAVVGPGVNIAEVTRERVAAFASVEGHYALEVWLGSGPSVGSESCQTGQDDAEFEG